MTEADLLGLSEDQLGPKPLARLGVAVSGGSDSVALLCALQRWAQTRGTEVSVISIDHGLRPAAREEVRFVGDLCARLGVDDHVEFWTGWDGGGNLQNAARMARYQLIADWAVGNDIDDVALGHTANDQAETVLMRLARGSGVDGLSGMAARRVQHGITWIRPLLTARRRDLRAYLRARGETWIEDPSNDDDAFERVRMRDALALLEPLGLTVDALAQVASHMRSARTALDWQTFLAAREIVLIDLGTMRLSLSPFRALPEEIARRLLVRAIMWIGGRDYAPRRASVETALQAIWSGQTVTLDGVQVERAEGEVWLFREYAAVRDLPAELGDLWDDRWTVTGPEDDPELEVRALGPEGLRQVKDWRDLGLPRAALLSMPGVWDAETLIAAPILDGDEAWQVEIEDGADTFYAALLAQ